jgi:leucyl aminopeptidase
MKISLKKCALKEVCDEFLALAVFQGEELPFPEITKFLRKDEFEGKLAQAQIVNTLGKFGFKKLFLFGLGEEKDFNVDYLRRFGGAATRYAASIKSNSFSIAVREIKNTPTEICAHAIVEGVGLSSYRSAKFKTKKEEIFGVNECTIIGDVDQAVIEHAKTLVNAQNYARELCELPPNVLTPLKFAEYAKELAKEKKLKITIFDKDALKKMKMNALLGVAQGSVNPPVLVVLEYNAGKKLPLYAVVGKGVMFDSGGISLKPSKGMHMMKYDKSGAVICLGIMKAVAELKLPIRLLAVMPAVENLPSGSAQKPGDIVTAYNGKTIEIINTDAEGRLILADALAYVAEKKPEIIFDIATLTGAIIVALGNHGIGLFTNDDELAKMLEMAGEKTYERVWRFPMWKEYAEMIKSDFADIKNIGSETGEAGSITAACFLREFIGETKWAHLDIAGVDNIETAHPYFDKGATAIGVRLIIEVLEELSKHGKDNSKK